MTAIRTVLALIVLLVGACTACSSGQLAALQPTSADVISTALESSITLYARDGDTVCAGVRVSPTEVVTAYHCAAAAVLTLDELVMLDAMGADLTSVDEKRLLHKTVRFSSYREVLAASDRKDRDRHNAVVVSLDADHDLALLKSADIGQGYSMVRQGSLTVGEDVFAVGHPAGLEFTFTRGYVATPCRKDYRLGNNECWAQIDITIWGGSSGGGLFDSAGNLVGIASSMLKPGQAFFVPSKFVAKL